MKKTLLALLSVSFLTVFALQARENIEKSRPGMRLEVLGGAGMFTGKAAPGQNINRAAYLGTVVPSVVFKDNRHAVGLMMMYRYNRLLDDFQYNTILSSPVDVDWRTVFVGPQYTFVAEPLRSASYFVDLGMGGVLLSEKTISQDDSFYKLDLSGFGLNMGIGGRFGIGWSTFFVVKFSMLVSTLNPDWAGDQRLNVSSLNVSLGFSFGK